MTSEQAARLLDVLDDVIQQACWDNTDETIDSMASSAYAGGIRLLAQHGRLVIDSDRGRRVIAHRAPAEQKGKTLMQVFDEEQIKKEAKP